MKRRANPAAPKLASAEGHLKRFRLIMDQNDTPLNCAMALRRLMAARDDLSMASAHVAAGGRTTWTAELRKRLSATVGHATNELELRCILRRASLAGTRRRG
jgi:hypothetical protein